jgi:hypothetical protein
VNLGGAVHRPEAKLGKPDAWIKALAAGACIGNMAAHLGMHAFACLVTAQRLLFQTVGRLFKAHRNRRFDGARVSRVFRCFGVGHHSHQCFKALGACIIHHIGDLYFGLFHFLNLFCYRMFGASVLIWTLPMKIKLFRLEKVSPLIQKNSESTESV